MFMSGFQVYSAESTDGSNKGTIDFDALNKYVVDECGLENPETLIGYVSNIVDLGTQILPDSEYGVDKGDEDLTIPELEDKHADKIEDGSISKFEVVWDYDTKSNMIKKFVPQKNRQAICYSVDFPDILIDKAPFFGGESNPLPLRLWIGGEWYEQEIKKMTISRVIALKKTKDEKVGWSMHPLSSLYKMAIGAKIINSSQAFQPEQIDKLLGKSLQFKAQVFFKEGKNGKDYYTERLNFVGGLARGQIAHEDVKTNLIQFHAENDETALKELRNHVINTMALATNFKGSVVEKQLIALGKFTPEEESTPDSVLDAANNSPTEGEDEFGW